MPRKSLGPGNRWWLSGLVVVAMAGGCEWVEPYEPLSRDPTTQPDASPQRSDLGSGRTDATREDAVAGAEGASGDAGTDEQGGTDATAADAPGADAVPSDGTGADTAMPDATTPDMDAFRVVDFRFPDFAIFLDGSSTCGTDFDCPLKYRCCGCSCVQSHPQLVCPDVICSPAL